MKNTRKLAWHHFKFQIPAEWEITAYSVEDRAGRIEFSTRRGFQALVAWEPCKRTPDTETMMQSFLRNHVPRSDSSRTVSIGNLKTQTVGSFLLGYQDEDQPCQAMHYLENERKLIWWVFTFSRKQLVKKVWPTILESFEPNTAEIREYAICGHNFCLPEEFSLEDMTVLPANVMISFESKQKVRATFRRWGMPELVLASSSLTAFYSTFLRSLKCYPQDIQTTTVSGMEAVSIRYEQRGEHKMDKFLGRLWKNGKAWLWHNRDEMRLYSFETIGPDKVLPLKFEKVFPHLK